jgi:hypothetical protein
MTCIIGPGTCHASAYILQTARSGSIVHRNPDQDHLVTAHSLRSLTSPATLAAFDAGLLHDLLVDHRAYLAAHGYVLPSLRASPLNLGAAIGPQAMPLHDGQNDPMTS